MKYYLYNSLANNGIKPGVKEGVELVDAVGIDYPEYLSKLAPEDEVVLVGGDGTINYFVNALDWDIENAEKVSLSARKFFDQRVQ